MTSRFSVFTTHGPCSTAVLGTHELDFAYCFKSEKISRRCPLFYKATSHIKLAIHVYIIENSKRRVPLCRYWCKRVPNRTNGMANIFFSHRKMFNSFYEPCSVPLLWSFKNIFEGGHRCQYRNQRTPVFIFSQDSFILGNFHRQNAVESFKFFILFLEMLPKTSALDKQ